MPKNCDRCAEEFTGWGKVCPNCRALPVQAVTSGGRPHKCSECGVYFVGFGAKCDACQPTAENPCAVCRKTAYPLESIVIEGQVFHKTCFKCHKCSCTLGVANWSKTKKGTYYCKTHFERLSKLRGRLTLDSLEEEGEGAQAPANRRDSQELHIDGLAGPICSLNVQVRDEWTVGTLKTAIEAETGIPADRQRIFCGEHEVEDLGVVGSHSHEDLLLVRQAPGVGDDEDD